jgi:hypothetical protein
MSSHWAVLIGLACVAVLMVAVLGPFGLVLLGLLTLLLCTLFELNSEVPTWGTGGFEARMGNSGSPEQRAAMREDRRAHLSPLRFYRWCGAALVLAGGAGFVWQQWR